MAKALRAWPLAVIGMAGVGPAGAAVEVTPLASVAENYDDNVFRDRKSEAQSDYHTTYAAGLDLGYTAGLQKFFLKGNASKTRYDRFEELDFDGHEIKSGANWQIGSALRGDLSLERTRDLRDFARQGDLARRSIEETTTGAASAHLRILKDYEMRVRATGDKRRNKALADRLQDIDEGSVGLAFSRIGALGSIGLEAVQGRGDFVEREPATGVVEEFDQSTLQLVGTWKPSTITSVDFSGGWTRRENEGVDVEDEDAFVAELELSRTVSVKTVVFGGLGRRLLSADQLGESTVLATEAHAGARWAATPKIQVSGRAYFTREDFRDAIAGASDREDDYRGLSLDLSYAPREWLVFRPSVALEGRSASGGGSDYSDFRAGLQLELRYPLVR